MGKGKSLTREQGVLMGLCLCELAGCVDMKQLNGF